MASTLKSLRLAADPNRLRLLLLLEQEELSVAELQEILSKGQSQISTHLAQLKQAGLVDDRRTGKNAFCFFLQVAISVTSRMTAEMGRKITFARYPAPRIKPRRIAAEVLGLCKKRTTVPIAAKNSPSTNGSGPTRDGPLMQRSVQKKMQIPVVKRNVSLRRNSAIEADAR